MATTLAAPRQSGKQETEWRMVVRHTPFANQVETVKASDKQEAWERFLAEMQGKVADPSRATEAGQRQAWAILKHAQTEWLRGQSAEKIPEDVSIIPEAEYGKRFDENRALQNEMIAQKQRESQSRNDTSIEKLAGAVAQIAEAQANTAKILEKLAAK